MTTDYVYEQGIETAMSAIDGRWKTSIVGRLAREGSPLRFNQLMAKVPGISPRILTLQLRELEKDGVIIRDVISTSPKYVEYSLSEHGKALLPILDQLAEWGLQATACEDVLSFETESIIQEKDKIQA